MAERLGVLVMAYGTPRGLDDVEAYYTDIRRGQRPSPEQLEELTARYRAIGGRSPLLDITLAQVAGIERRLGDARAYLGQKHAAPGIPEAVATMAADGVERAVGLVLAPHYSSMSVGDYARRAAEAADGAGWSGRLDVIRSWHLEPGYIDLLSARLCAALRRIPPEARASTTVVFTAHSLPRRILESGDPYVTELEATAAAVARTASLQRWRVGWQSAGATADDWLAPDILAIVDELAGAGAGGVVVCPCGFVADHLEVLYDLDIEAARAAASHGLAFARTSSPNDAPEFLDTLAAVARRALGRGRVTS